MAVKLALKRRVKNSYEFWAGNVDGKDLWEKDLRLAILFDESERYAIRHNGTSWHTLEIKES